MPAAHRTQCRSPASKQNCKMKRRTMIGELGIAPGNLISTSGYVRASKHIVAGDLLSIISIGGNGRCVKMLALLVRGEHANIAFNVNAYESLPLSSIA